MTFKEKNTVLHITVFLFIIYFIFCNNVCAQDAATAKGKDINIINIQSPPKEMYSVLTLDECLDIAIKNSLALQIAGKNIKLAELRLWESRRNLFPKVSVVYEESKGRVQAKAYTGRKQYVEGSSTLPIGQGAETYYIMRQTELNLKVVKEEYDKAKNELILQVKKAYYSLAKSKENLKVQRVLSEEVKAILDSVKKQFEAGIASKVEYLNVTSQASQVAYQLMSAESDVVMSSLILKQAMNLEPKDSIDIDSKLDFERIDIDYDDAIKAAFNHRQEVKINMLTVEYNKYEKDIGKAKGWPKVDLMGNWGLAKEEYASEDLNNNPAIGAIDQDRKLEQQWYAGIKVGVPVWGSTAEYSQTREQWVTVVSAFQGTEATTDTYKFNVLDKMNYFSDKLAADVSLDKARQDFIKIKQDVTVEVREGCFNYEKALLQLDTAEKKVKFQETDYEVIKFRRQMDEALDSNVVESMIKLGQEKFGYIQALSDCHTTLAALNKAVGLEDYFRVKK